MTIPQDRHSIEALAYHLWEREGRPEGRQHEHWIQAERLLAPDASGIEEADRLDGDVAKLDGDLDKDGYQQDTPGRPKTSSSRQQTQPAQSTLTGAAELDKKGGKPRASTRSSRKRQ